MADNNNNNNNGNQVVNPNNNTGRGTDNSDLKLSIANLGIDLGKNIKDSANEVIKAIKENSGSGNGSSGGNRSSNAKLKTETEKIIEEFGIKMSDAIDEINDKGQKSIDRSLSQLRKVQDAARRGNEDAKRIMKALGDNASKYETLITNAKQAQTKVDTLTETKKQNEELIKALKEHREKLDENSADYETEVQQIELKLKNIEQNNKQLDRQLKTANKQKREANADLKAYKKSDDFKQLDNSLKAIKDAGGDLTKVTRSIELEQRRENKRKARQEKINEAKEYRIAENLEDCFEGGLFSLSSNLDKTFKDATKNHITAMQGTIAGKIAGFVEKSLFSVADYYTERFTEAISTLQQSFESTGMQLSKAILLDRNEIVNEYQDVANELKEAGYSESLNVTDILGFEAQMANAGIVNKDLSHAIAVEFSKISAKTGVGLPDLLSDEILTDLQSYYKTTGGDVSVVKDAMEQFANSIINGVDTFDSATGIANGKIQETANSYFKNISRYGIDTATTAAQSQLSAQLGLGQYSGGTSIYQRLISGLESARTGNVSEDILSIISSGVITQGHYNALMEKGEYLGALEDMLRNISTLSEGDTTNTVLNWLGVSPEDWRNLTANGNDVEKLISEMEEAFTAMQEGGLSEEVQRRETLVKEGRTSTVEQNIKNREIANAANIWGATVKTGIPEATKGLISAINTANDGIQSAISWGVEKMINAFFGSTGTGLVGSAIGGTGGTAGAASSGAVASGGMRLSKFSNKTVSGGTAAVAGIASFIAGWEVGKKLDEIFHLSDSWSSAWAGNVAGTQDAIDNLATIQTNNERENAQREKIIADHLKNIEVSSDTIKQSITDNIPNITEGITNMNNAKENVATTIRSTIERGESLRSATGSTTTLGALAESHFGKPIEQVSDEELVKWYESSDDTALNEIKNLYGKSELADITQAQDNYKHDLSLTAATAVNAVLADAMADGQISADESQTISQDFRKEVTALGLSKEDEQLFYDYLGERMRDANENYNSYQAAVKVLKQIQKMEGLYIAENPTSYSYDDLKRIALAIKSGSSDDMGDVTAKDLELASPYMLSDEYNRTNPLSIISEDVNAWELYAPSNVEKFATGLDYVPYDNYLALLHKGERVQTAAEARLDDLADSIAYNSTTNSNITNTNNNIDGLNTTNNSIKDGFNTTNSNQETIIEALKTIISALSNGNSAFASPDVFESITNNKVALRSNNIARMASMH